MWNTNEISIIAVLWTITIIWILIFWYNFIYLPKHNAEQLDKIKKNKMRDVEEGRYYELDEYQEELEESLKESGHR